MISTTRSKLQEAFGKQNPARCASRGAGLRHLACAVAAQAVLAGFLIQAGGAVANTAPALDRVIVASGTTPKRPPATSAAANAASARANARLVTASKTGPGQAGYIHYFVLTTPAGERESQIGIELEDQRIAWSLPEIGVVISRFIGTGAIVVNGETYELEHLYGIRPFADDEAMRILQRELPARVVRWVEDQTPHCEDDDAWSGRCVSCLGFVLRVLYPGRSTTQPALPADFKSARKNAYSTEDLLLYLAGVRVDASREARMRHIETLAVPEEMREQLIRLASAVDNPALTSAKTDTLRAAAKFRPPVRSLARSQKRAIPRRRS